MHQTGKFTCDIGKKNPESVGWPFLFCFLSF